MGIAVIGISTLDLCIKYLTTKCLQNTYIASITATTTTYSIYFSPDFSVRYPVLYNIAKVTIKPTIDGIIE